MSIMALKPTTIRFSEDGQKIVAEAAKRVGCTSGQFVREAALLRAASIMGDEFPMVMFERAIASMSDEGRRAYMRQLVGLIKGVEHLSLDRPEKRGSVLDTGAGTAA